MRKYSITDIYDNVVYRYGMILFVVLLCYFVMILVELRVLRYPPAYKSDLYMDTLRSNGNRLIVLFSG